MGVSALGCRQGEAKWTVTATSACRRVVVSHAEQLSVVYRCRSHQFIVFCFVMR